MAKVWIYEYGRDEMKTFKSEEEAQAWLAIHDPEGVAFAYEQGELIPAGTADEHGVPKAEE
jgi:viroplasmin and RNaseH domain-containing protein